MLAPPGKKPTTSEIGIRVDCFFQEVRAPAQTQGLVMTSVLALKGDNWTLETVSRRLLLVAGHLSKKTMSTNSDIKNTQTLEWALRRALLEMEVLDK
jgi:hypothetical protein